MIFRYKRLVQFNACILLFIFHLIFYFTLLYSFAYTIHFNLHSLYLVKSIFHLPTLEPKHGKANKENGMEASNLSIQNNVYFIYVKNKVP